MSEFVRLEPPTNELTQTFWDATRERRLLLQWCTRCSAAVFYPRSDCPRCFGSSMEWRESPGRGEVYAVTVENRPQNPQLAAMAPYAVALIDLDEGVRLLSNVVEVDPQRVIVGMRVVVAWEELSDGRRLPVFRPDDGRA